MSSCLRGRSWTNCRSLGRSIHFVALAVMLAISPAAGLGAQEAEPSAVVSTFQDRLLATMKEWRALGFEGRYDYGMVGTAVIRASRLSSAAGPDQILLSPASHAEVAGLFEVEELGEVQLKGFSRPISPVNVLGPRTGALRPAAGATAGLMLEEA